MMDLLERVKCDRKITYVFFDTGIEYEATKRHLDELEEKYGVKIERRRAKKPVPAGCRDFGLPFLSKEVSDRISILQHHGFQFEDEPYDVLSGKYSGCHSALKWWCNMKQKGYGIESYLFLKEYMSHTPPSFRISKMCCKGAKKNTAKQIYHEFDCCLTIIGIRRAEGGIRATSYKSCFDQPEDDKMPSYRPLFFWSDDDKEQYKNHYGIKYSDCYEVWGMKRTGCAGCPFNSRF